MNPDIVSTAGELPITAGVEIITSAQESEEIRDNVGGIEGTGLEFTRLDGSGAGLESTATAGAGLDDTGLDDAELRVAGLEDVELEKEQTF